MSAVPKDAMPVTQGQIAILEEMIGERIARVEERCRALEAENNELRKRVKVLTDKADAELLVSHGAEAAKTPITTDTGISTDDLVDLWRHLTKTKQERKLAEQLKKWVE